NSDQGSHFTSNSYIERLLSHNVQISMDGKGRAIDNIFTERLWRSIKYEEVYLNEYDTPGKPENESGNGSTCFIMPEGPINLWITKHLGKFYQKEENQD
ncbi:integrase, catalytic region, partial [mine drainage metagenome]